MKGEWIWTLGKGLEGLGLLVIGVGLMMSISLGMNDEGLSSMKSEMYGLLVGSGLFLCGWLIERSGSRP